MRSNSDVYILFIAKVNKEVDRRFLRGIFFKVTDTISFFQNLRVYFLFILISLSKSNVQMIVLKYTIF